MPLVLFEFAFEALEQCERVGSATGEASQPLTLLMAAPRDELQAFQIESRRHGFYISLGLMLLLLPVVHLLADRVSRPLRQLARQAEAMQ